MDIKAMAKSKRSHTKHHQPRKPHPHSKTPSSSSSSSSSSSTATTSTAASNASDSKASNREGRERKRATQPPSLPSNWGRYDDEDPEAGDEVEVEQIDSDSDQPNRPAASKEKMEHPVVVEPKSQGADYRDLIAQAKESRSCFPSFDDTLSDLYQGLGPMLAVRGENILSWHGGDDFIADDEATAGPEASFLSLDLEALAEQLAKVDLAKRLFIEEDLLPPELHAQEATKADNQVPFQKSEKQKNAAPETFDELYALYLAEEHKAQAQNDMDEDGDLSSLPVVSSCISDTAFAADMTERKSNDIDFLNAKQINQDSGPSSRFGAEAAEAELDRLLDSFNETKLYDSQVATSTKQHETALSFSKGESAFVGAPSHLMRPSRPAFPVNSSLDDALDDLLEETANPNIEGGLAQSIEIKAGRGNSATDGGPSQLLAPSRPAFPVTSSLDDGLDDLLEETSKQNDADGLVHSKEVKAASLDLACSSSSSSVHPSTQSKVLEDFDSWFDTI